jgi:tetratricopeptide (TPR) repeat protein
MTLRLVQDHPDDGAEQQQLFPADDLCRILQVSLERLNSWISSGLINPVTRRDGVAYFDFSQVNAARSLCDLVRSGIHLGKLQRVLERLRAQRSNLSLDRLVAVGRDGRVLFRSEHGLIQDDGQLHLEFADGAEASPVSLRVDQPTTAEEFFADGVAAEVDENLERAAECYRNALRAGGPDAQICFDLAGVLMNLGHKYQALERYLQTVEINPQHGDAWNNLGVLMAELDRQEEACAAFREAVVLQPRNTRALYNLADCLDELGKDKEARESWEAYLRLDNTSEYAAYARKRLRAT